MYCPFCGMVFNVGFLVFFGVFLNYCFSMTVNGYIGNGSNIPLLVMISD